MDEITSDGDFAKTLQRHGEADFKEFLETVAFGSRKKNLSKKKIVLRNDIVASLQNDGGLIDNFIQKDPSQ